MSSRVLPTLLALMVLAAPAGAAALRFERLADGSQVTLPALAKELARPGIVYLGERHDRAQDHALQLAVLTALHAAGATLAVGLEMWPAADQARLDDWVAGRVDEVQTAKAFAGHWGDAWPLYRDIFRFCRERRVPMVGLNVPREVVRKVATEGFASLTPEEIGLLPPIACQVAPDYAKFIRRMYGAHGHGSGDFTHFCEAQMVWDAGMAAHAVRYCGTHPRGTLAVLCGTIHAWKPAIPHQVSLLLPKVVQTVIEPQGSAMEAAGPADADFRALP